MNPSDATSIPTAQPGRIGKGETALLVILGIETVLFGTLSSSYLLMRAAGPAWDVHAPLQVRLIFPAANTLLMLASAWVLSRSVTAARQGNRPKLLAAQQIALLMGLLFITGQVYDFSHSGMAVNDTGFGGAFFALLGFHAVHVLAGVVVLSLNIMRTYLGDFRPSEYTAIRTAAWFWYFVTFVWVILFLMLYGI
jgi:cytochrome c oxidase subunit 3